MQRDAVPFVPGFIAPPQHGSVVPSHLCAAGPVRRGPVELVHDQRLDRVSPVVNPRGQHVNSKSVFLGRAQPQLRRGAVNLGTNVHCRPRLVGRNKLGVQRHGSLDRVDEQLDRHGGNRDKLGRMLKARRVLVRAKDGDLLVTRQAERLEPLVGLLTVVERGRHAVDADVRIHDEG